MMNKLDIEDTMEYKWINNFLLYLINTDGKIWSSYSEKWLRLEKKKDGYLRVTLSQQGKVVRYYVHRLVLETFVGPCPIGMECRHLDGNKQNNKLDNMVWGTRKENAQDSIKQGRHPTVNQQGENNPTSKLTNSKVKRIRVWYETGLYTHQYIADLFGVSRQTIANVVNKVSWSHI